MSALSAARIPQPGMLTGSRFKGKAAARTAGSDQTSAPLSTPDSCREEAQVFLLKGTFSMRREAVPTSSSAPAVIMGQPGLRWLVHATTAAPSPPCDSPRGTRMHFIAETDMLRGLSCTSAVRHQFTCWTWFRTVRPAAGRFEPSLSGYPRRIMRA